MSHTHTSERRIIYWIKNQIIHYRCIENDEIRFFQVINLRFERVSRIAVVSTLNTVIFSNSVATQSNMSQRRADVYTEQN